MEPPRMKDYEKLEAEFNEFKSTYKDAIQKENAKKILKPYQEELLKLQRHLEKHNKKMKKIFTYKLKYPSYVEGLKEIHNNLI